MTRTAIAAALLVLVFGAGASAGAPATGVISEIQFGPLTPYDYPKAEVVATSNAGTLHQVGATTPDDPTKVLAYYEKILGGELAATCTHGTEERRIASFNDSRSAGSDARGADIRVLTEAAKDHVVTITISRLPDEALTHIVLIHAGQP